MRKPWSKYSTVLFIWKDPQKGIGQVLDAKANPIKVFCKVAWRQIYPQSKKDINEKQ